MKKAKTNKKADKAYLKAVEEIEKDRIDEVKIIVKQVLEGIIVAQKERKAADEKLALLKQDLNDIRQGKVDRIKERHNKVKEEKKWVPFDAEKLQEIMLRPTAYNSMSFSTSTPANSFTNSLTHSGIGHSATNGTFILSDGTEVNMSH